MIKLSKNKATVSDKIAVFKIPTQKEGVNQTRTAYGHIIDYKGMEFTWHSSGDVSHPLGKITTVYSIFETGYLIKKVDYFAMEIGDYDSLEKTKQWILNDFNELVKPLIDGNWKAIKRHLKEVKKINHKVKWENGEFQALLDKAGETE